MSKFEHTNTLYPVRRWVLALALLLGGCQTHTGVVVRGIEPEEIKLGADSASLPSGAINYRIAPLDTLHVDVHRIKGVTERADYGTVIQAEFFASGKEYHISPGDVISLTLQFENDRDSLLTVRPDGYVTLPRIGIDVEVAGLTMTQLTRLIGTRYGAFVTRPDITLSLAKSNLDQLMKLSGTYPVSRDGHIVIPTLGALPVIGQTTEDLIKQLREAVQRTYRNWVNISASIAENTANDASVMPNAEGRRYFRETVKVSADGTLYLPVGGAFQAAGMTLAELNTNIGDRFRSMYQNPIEVYVGLSESNSMSVFVAGEVRQPGRLQYQPAMTILQVLASAGWVTEGADLTQVSLLHQSEPGKYIVYQTNLREVYEGNGARFQDLRLSPRDVVIVPRSGVAKMNLLIDQYVRRMLPFSTGLSYTFVNGNNSTVP